MLLQGVCLIYNGLDLSQSWIQRPPSRCYSRGLLKIWYCIRIKESKVQFEDEIAILGQDRRLDSQRFGTVLGLWDRGRDWVGTGICVPIYF
ncbi:hypothetical protein Ahy_B01g051860 isoform B [Arachis hypogaea]|uniref:Uncharacterized protein n=1 Tax=Arachis hypogaea TaxID=3818 RepID=A0A445AMY0_ARAHY|nr:hypothetical protein Ahy_B01g051860 isoform B [Arachis hypogaea]